MRPESDRGLLARLGGGGDYVEYLPVGVIGIALPASLPLLRTADILASALAAGNRVMLKFDDPSSKLIGLVGRLAPGFFHPLDLPVAPDGAFADLAFYLCVTGGVQGNGGRIPLFGKSRSADHTPALQTRTR